MRCASILACLLLLFILIGCNQNSTTVTQMESETTSITPMPSSAPERTSPAVYVTSTHEPTEVNVEIATDIPQTPSATAEPTLESDIRTTAIANGMGYGLECTFPCFLGITPGVTRWADAEAQLQRLGAEIQAQFDDTKMNGAASAHLFSSDADKTYLIGGVFEVVNGTVVSVEVLAKSNPVYRMAALVDALNQDVDLRFSSAINANGGPAAELVAISLRRGVAALYTDWNATADDLRVKACIGGAGSLEKLWVFAPGSFRSSDEFLEAHGLDPNGLEDDSSKYYAEWINQLTPVFSGVSECVTVESTVKYDQ